MFLSISLPLPLKSIQFFKAKKNPDIEVNTHFSESKIIRHAKKQKNVTHNQKKSQSIETNTRKTDITELAN